MATDLTQLIRRVPRVVWFLVGLWWTARVWERIFNLQVGSTSGGEWPSDNSELASILYWSLPIALLLASRSREPLVAMLLSLAPMAALAATSDAWVTSALRWAAAHPDSTFLWGYRQLEVRDLLIKPPPPLACWELSEPDCRAYAQPLIAAWAPAFAVWTGLFAVLTHHSVWDWRAAAIRRRIPLAAVAAAALILFDRTLLSTRYSWGYRTGWDAEVALLGLACVSALWLPNARARLHAAIGLAGMALLPLGTGHAGYWSSDLGPGLLHLPMGVLIMFTVWGILAPPPRPATTPADPSASR